MNPHQMTTEQIEAFCTALQISEHSANTIAKYRRDLTAFYMWLPPEKQVDKEQVLAYKAEKMQQYATASLNSILCALRSFFKFMEWYECNVKLLKVQKRIFSAKELELTRAEYNRLVETAEGRGNGRLSLLLQIMASTGIRVSEIQYVTVEAAKKGKGGNFSEGEGPGHLASAEALPKTAEICKKRAHCLWSNYAHQTGQGTQSKGNMGADEDALSRCQGRTKKGISPQSSPSVRQNLLCCPTRYCKTRGSIGTQQCGNHPDLSSLYR